MDFHPRDLQVAKTYDLRDEKDASDAVEDMVRLGFGGGFRVMMPRDRRTAKRIGYTVTTGVTHGLRQSGGMRDIRYWTYMHDDEHFATVLISSSALKELGL